jgi:hypothetical protein
MFHRINYLFIFYYKNDRYKITDALITITITITCFRDHDII